MSELVPRTDRFDNECGKEGCQAEESSRAPTAPPLHHGRPELSHLPTANLSLGPGVFRSPSMGIPLYRDMRAITTDEAGQPDSTTPGGLGLVLPRATCPLSSGVSAVSLLTSHLLAIFQ